MTFRHGDALCAREAEDAPARQPDFLDESRERLSTQVTVGGWRSCGFQCKGHRAITSMTGDGKHI